MNKSKQTPVKSLKSTVKGKKHKTQLQIIHSYLSKRLATSTMVSAATGIPQKCCTRYKRTLEKSGALMEIVKKPCKITGFYAWYITTDVEQFNEAEPSKQLNLFK
jgi:hypothetical protein